MKYISLSLFLIIVYSLSYSQARHEYLRIPVDKDGNLNFATLREFEKELKGADVVLLGEPYHNPTFYPFKIKVLKYLVDHLGFNVVAFESGLFQMEMVNQDIKSGHDIASAFDKGLFPVWTSTWEFEELYHYLDSLRTIGKQINITGFDCQISASNASTRFISEVTRLLGDATPGFEATLKKLQRQFESLETGKAGLTADFDIQFTEELSSLEKFISARHGNVMIHQALAGFIAHFTDLYQNKIVEKMRNGTYSFKDNNVRDSLMAKHMIYLRETLYKNKKIIGWGANLHFANEVHKMKSEQPMAGYYPMGYHLKKKYGDRVYILTITTGNNIPQTLEWDLEKSEVHAAYFTKQHLAKDSIATIALSNQLRQKNDFSQITDGLMYFRPEPLEFSNQKNAYLSAKITDSKTKTALEFASVLINGTNIGAITDSNGEFSLRLDSAHKDKMLTISCIGYSTKQVAVKSLVKNRRHMVIPLAPEVELLREVVIEASAPDPKHIYREMLQRIPENYAQQPFNMQYYSAFEMNDTTENKRYKLETVFDTYSSGYRSATQRGYRIIHKREEERYFADRKKYGASQWPMVEVAFCDLLSDQFNTKIYSLELVDKINLKLNGVKILDGDTVFVLTYDHMVRGEFYISTRDYAVLKHIIFDTGKSFRNRMEVSFKAIQGKYFPTYANGEYLHVYKVDKRKRFIKMNNKVGYLHLELENVEPFSMNIDRWTATNIIYDQKYWDEDFTALNVPTGDN